MMASTIRCDGGAICIDGRIRKVIRFTYRAIRIQREQ
jgi:hypothetical protein